MISELFYLETGEEIHLYLILLEEDTEYNISYLSRSFKKPFISINKLFENRIKGREKLSSKDILSIIH